MLKKLYPLTLTIDTIFITEFHLSVRLVKSEIQL